jgi:hypothetical protein
MNDGMSMRCGSPRPRSSAPRSCQSPFWPAFRPIGTTRLPTVLHRYAPSRPIGEDMGPKPLRKPTPYATLRLRPYFFSRTIAGETAASEIRLPAACVVAHAIRSRQMARQICVTCLCATRASGIGRGRGGGRRLEDHARPRMCFVFMPRTQHKKEKGCLIVLTGSDF